MLKASFTLPQLTSCRSFLSHSALSLGMLFRPTGECKVGHKGAAGVEVGAPATKKSRMVGVPDEPFFPPELCTIFFIIFDGIFLPKRTEIEFLVNCGLQFFFELAVWAKNRPLWPYHHWESTLLTIGGGVRTTHLLLI